MRRIESLSLWLFIVMTFALMSMTIDVNDLSIPQYVVRKLKKDAARLAVRMESEGKKLSEQEIEISGSQAKVFYKILASIYESSHSKKLKIFDCDIRVATDIAIDKFWIVYDKDVSWAPVSQNDVYEVDGDVGDLLDEYELLVTEKKNWDATREIITVESTQLYNLKVLIEEFRYKEGIHDVMTCNSAIKPDSDIQISYSNGKWNVAFIKKWSSLEDSKSHTWVFEVDESSFEIKYKGRSGDTIPDWMDCEKD